MTNEMKNLIWEVAGKSETNLEWIVDAKDQFRVGEVRRDDRGYFVSVTDIIGEKESKVYIPEETLRNEEFTDDIENANREYNLNKQYETLHEENRKREIASKLKKVALTTVLATGATLLVGLTNKSYNSPEKVAERERIKLAETREKEIDRKAVYLTDMLINKHSSNPNWKPETEKKEYNLNDLGKVNTQIITKVDQRGAKRFAIMPNENTMLISEYWTDYPSDDAKNLEYIEIKEGDNWIRVEDISDKRREEFRTLIERVYEMDSTNNN
ncbi:MAG: hypothetical protein KC506_01030 [Nanoarchaeota archaeon]|nr:hypothetical protein [Nanoarchaeota archaeon]